MYKRASTSKSVVKSLVRVRIVPRGRLSDLSECGWPLHRVDGRCRMSLWWIANGGDQKDPNGSGAEPGVEVTFARRSFRPVYVGKHFL